MSNQTPLLKTATFASGCFWCTEAIFKQVKGVLRVTPGYTGGETPNPTYETIHTGKSGHAEAVQIEFDPNVVAFETLVKIFFGTHDPTQTNGQGNDMGKEYRSIILCHDQKQREIAERVKNELMESGVYEKPIVTTIETYTNFYEAEKEHKDFYERNPNQPYCQIVIDSKVAKFRKTFSQYLSK